jgi:hypothetical protein
MTNVVSRLQSCAGALLLLVLAGALLTCLVGGSTLLLVGALLLTPTTTHHSTRCARVLPELHGRGRRRRALVKPYHAYDGCLLPPPSTASSNHGAPSSQLVLVASIVFRAPKLPYHHPHHLVSLPSPKPLLF